MTRSASLPFAGVVVLATLAAVAVAQDAPFPWTDYAEMRQEVVRLYQQEKFADAAAILERGIAAFPDKLRANTVNLALMRVRLGRLDEAVGALEAGLAGGVWYGRYDFHGEIWAPLKAHPRFAAVVAESEARRAAAEKLVTPRLDVVVPPGVAPGERLPLFLALHGGGENVDAFKPHWTSPLLAQSFVVAYPQSTQLVAPDGFDWMQDVPRTLKELRAVYDGLLRDYPVDPTRVVVGGFSSGGAAAIELVLADTFPVAGFVSLCPPLPPGFSREKATAAAARGVHGTLLTTERDGRLAGQREIAAVMKDTGLLLDFVVTPDLGHWYPDDLAERIDATLRAVVRLGRPAPGELATVEQVVRDSIGWARTKDRARLESILAHDASFFVFHPDSKSTVRGWPDFAPLLEWFMDPRFAATSSDVRDLAVEFSRSGDVAWFSATLDDCGAWDGKPSCWNDARWTGVLERRDGRWVIVQMHFSLASDAVRAACRDAAAVAPTPGPGSPGGS